MNKPTSSLCANFGHNFFRERLSDGLSDIVKCKHCELEVTLNHEGDLEQPEEDRSATHKVMKELFLLRNMYTTRLRKPIFSFYNL